MDKGTKEVSELLTELTAAGWRCVEVGNRWRCTGPAGEGPGWVPKRVTKTGNINAVRGSLAKAGFKPGHEAEGKVFTPPPPQQVEGGPQSEVRMVGADDAADLLAKNSFYGTPDAGRTNRPFSEAYARKLATEMLAGRWHLTHQGVAIGTDGTLLDGQHRLAAVVYASEIQRGLRVPMMVTTGLDPESFVAMDAGRKRTAADVLGVDGEENRVGLAAALKLLYCWEAHVPASEDWNRYTVSSESIRQTLAGHPAMRDAVVVGSRLRPAGLIVSGATTGYYVVQRAQPEAGKELHERFVEGLVTGANLASGDPRLALRNTLTNMRRARRKMVGMEHLALYVKTWNLWVKEKSRQTITWRTGEDMPKPAVAR